MWPPCMAASLASAALDAATAILLKALVWAGCPRRCVADVVVTLLVTALSIIAAWLLRPCLMAWALAAQARARPPKEFPRRLTAFFAFNTVRWQPLHGLLGA